MQLLSGRDVVLGGPRGLPVTRTLPGRDVRMVGAWCFVDHYGPHPLAGSPGMVVPPHPHTGLQTVSWLVQGAIRHRDSLGNDQLITPGGLNLMTAGRGISHAEHSPPGGAHGEAIHGVQLWLALPDNKRFTAATFEHHPTLPTLDIGDARARVLLGELAGASSPGTVYSPLVGAEITLSPGAGLDLPARPDFEYAVMVLAGEARVEQRPLSPGPMLYFGTGRDHLALAADTSARVLVLGGEPFDEQLVMWWNFVGRDHDEIVAFRQEWQAGGFGCVAGAGDRLPAPELPNARLAPRPGHRLTVHAEPNPAS